MDGWPATPKDGFVYFASACDGKQAASVLFVESCPLGTGKWLAWKGGYYQQHFIARDQLIGEFDTRQLAEEAFTRQEARQ